MPGSLGFDHKNLPRGPGLAIFDNLPGGGGVGMVTLGID